MLPDWLLTPLFYTVVVLILAALVAEFFDSRGVKPESASPDDDPTPRESAIERRPSTK